MRPSASWAIDSEPIRARGIIVNDYTVRSYDVKVLKSDRAETNFVKQRQRLQVTIFTVY